MSHCREVRVIHTCSLLLEKCVCAFRSEMGMCITGRENSMHILRPHNATGMLSASWWLVCRALWGADRSWVGWGRLSQLCRALPALICLELTL